MMITGKDYEDFLGLRPLNVQAALPGSRCALVSGRDIAATARSAGAIVMAANIRNPLSALGILQAARDADSFVMLELAKSEARYCGVSFANLPQYAEWFSAGMGDGVVFALHMDHYAVKSPADRNEALSSIPDAIGRGWTSVAIDASHNPDYRNLMFTRDVALGIPASVGLEVEVGEIRGSGVLSTVEEASFFIGGLNSWGVFPDFLAISNGSKHGTYDASAGESEGIDLARTREIADAIAAYDVVIAQHGISGTPLDKVGRFRQFGIHKGNVGTLWQNVVFGLEMDPASGNAVIEKGSYVKRPDRGVTPDLWADMVAYADSKGWSRSSGDYKSLNLPFHHRIMSLPQAVRDGIVEETREWAARYFEAFGSAGTGTAVMERVLSRGDHNAAPARKVTADRGRFGPADAPDARSGAASDGRDYSD